MYYFTQAQRDLINQTALDPNPPGGNALANMYDLIYQIIQQPDVFGNVADGNVIAWFGAAAQTNRGIGGASDFIRSYTQAQLEIRSDDALPDVSSTLQTASDAIADAVRLDIVSQSTPINGVDYYALPTAHEIGEKDAIETLDSLSGFSSSPGIWSGNPLYLGLGDGSFWYNTILETDGDTYDLLAAAKSFWIAGIDSLANTDDLVSLWYGQGSAGRAEALNQVAAALTATNSFFESAYGYFGELGVSGLLGDQVVVGSEGSDLSLEEQLGLSWNTFIHGGAGNDLLVGSLGEDTLDGGTDHDDATFYLVSEEMSEGLHAAIFSLDSDAQFSAEVTGTDLQSFVFNVEELKLGRHDDILEVVDLYYDTSSLTDVYAGDNGVLGDKIDLSSVTVQGAIVNLENGTLRLTDGQWQIEVHDFENVVGTSHNDTITGDDQANGINGHLGADVLIGGGGDDFIFFDAADGENVDGGSGRDVAVALGSDGVTVDIAAQGLECVIGCDGVDTITVAGIAPGPDELLYAAGGGGSDTFIVTHNPGEGPKVLWGGAGADHFDFRLTDPDYSRDQIGIAVVHIEGLTEEAFSRLTLANLGLGGIDISKLDAIIINPDGLDSYFWGGAPLTTSNIDLLDYDDVGYYSHFVSGYDTPASFEVRSSSYLGGTQSIQSVFSNEIRVQHEITFNFDYLDITVWSGGDYEVVETETYNERPYESLQAAIDEAKFIAELEFEQYAPYSEYGTTPEYWTMTYHETDSDVPHYYAPFFVVGGTFSGGDLSANGQLIGSLPDDSGPSAFDWLLAA